MGESNGVLPISDQEFNEKVLQSKDLTLVDFWAEWCGPCRMLAPTIEAIAKEMTGKMKVCKMNVDENPETPGRFSIRGIPTLILFRDGEAVDQLVGNQPKEVIVQAIQRQLGH